jgi:hypothetical protein
MTEAEWLTCEDSMTMLMFLREYASDRKFRLFGASCYRNRWATITVAEVRWDVLRASEAFADRRITKAEFKLARKKVTDHNGPFVSGEALEVAARSAQDCSGGTWSWITTSAGYECKVVHQYPEEIAAQCVLIRDIFGNPFRPVAFFPSWRTSTVLALAKGMYESRDFSAMPILADALQDAGCDSNDILNHCRDEKAKHVRGCWVVDLVLEK